VSAEQWIDDNSRYLSAALTWVRLLLERQASRSTGTALVPVAPSPTPVASRGWRLGRGPARPAATPNAPHPNLANEVERAAEAMAAAEATMSPPPALAILSELLRLSEFERHVLLLCAAAALDTGIATLCGRALNQPERAHPSFALALILFEEAAWDVLSPRHPLRYWRLIQVQEAGVEPLVSSPLRAEERVVNYLKGLNDLDDRLASLTSPLAPSPYQGPLPPSFQGLVDSVMAQFRQATVSGSLPLVQLLGHDRASKRLLAERIAAELKLSTLRIPLALFPQDPAEVESLARLWERESLLLPIALYVDAGAAESNGVTESQFMSLDRFLGRVNRPIFLDVHDFWRGADRPSTPVEVGKPTAAEQRQLWAENLTGVGAAPDLLAGQFDLGPVAIVRVVTSISDQPPDGTPPLVRAWDACLAATRPRLELLTQRLEPKATWNDIVLRLPERALLEQIAAQTAHRTTVYESWGYGRRMNRGRGISVLFTGESGTGKTMAAEVIAHALRLHLYRIDLSAVVSKYIGETEKNLRRLFDAAEDGGAILFFDEADALFGKRSEVKDSHDRYANIEINYLLQRMEAYSGLAILATNMKSALDTAFIRRLRFIVNFPFPGPAERRTIWERVFPPESPRRELDFDRLAQLNLTGGSIHNVALNAAFMAAATGDPLTMRTVLDAARGELIKLERPVNEADFAWQPAGAAP
jgi:hypothetical protein